jgi:hypothetical protein
MYHFFWISGNYYDLYHDYPYPYGVFNLKLPSPHLECIKQFLNF